MSDRARFITGQAHAIDGGMSQVMPEGEAFPEHGTQFTSLLDEKK